MISMNKNNLTDTENLLSALKTLKTEAASRYKAEMIGLFGSFVRGEQRETSDIDILADFDEEADLFDLVGLSQFLEEKLHRKVDIVSRNALRTELCESVFREIVVL